MAPKLLPIKIEQAIDTAGLSKVEVAEKLGVSRQTLDSYIKGLSVINSVKLAELAALTGRTLDFFYKNDAEETKIFFRAVNAEKIPPEYRVEAEERLRKYAELEELTDAKLQYVLPEFPLNEYEKKEIESAAARTRFALGLTQQTPISDIFDVLEQVVKIIQLNIKDKAISGFSAYSSRAGACVFINSNITLERRVFTAAHELGHIIMHRAAYKANITQAEYKKSEQIANYFAGVFLVPAEALQISLRELGKTFSWSDLLTLKLKFRISAEALLYRLMQEQVIDKNQYGPVRTHIRKQFGETEPEPALDESQFLSLKKASRFDALLKRALFQEKIGPSKLAELAGLSQKEFRESLRRWQQEEEGICGPAGQACVD